MRLTSVLDLAGLLLLVSCAAVAVSTFALWAALGVAGAGVLASSWLIDRIAKGAKR